MGTLARRSIRAGVVTLAAFAAVAATGLSAWAIGYFEDSPDSAVTGEVLVSTDGRTLTASVFWNGCEDRPSLVADETSSTVTLQIERHRHAPAGAVCDQGQAQHLAVPLNQPLGSRHLGSAGQGSGIGTFMAADLRQPGYLPVGYTPTADVAANVDSPPVHIDYSGPHFVVPPTPSWERGYATSRYGALFITQTVGNSAPTSGASVSVNGHPGHFTVLPPTGQQVGETLSWFDGTYTMKIQEQDPGLTQADVLRVAQNLH
ncbi:hypothetical protein ABIA33_007451 [Streptacidiphilus sp. MAP12-16]|uniref:hypothetical protein n=1 Tax=Streptacidiphilus sp. MAP12-16 TaxID=3156300 RepID=UPI0035148F1E